MNQPMPMQPTSNCDEKFPTAKALCLLIQNYYFQQQQNFVMNGMAGMELQQLCEFWVGLWDCFVWSWLCFGRWTSCTTGRVSTSKVSMSLYDLKLHGMSFYNLCMHAVIGNPWNTIKLQYFNSSYRSPTYFQTIALSGKYRCKLKVHPLK